MTDDRKSEETCCPEFDLTPWDETTHVWTDKRFIKETIPVFFHFPWPPMIGRLVTRMWKAVQDAGAAGEPSEVLLLNTDPSPWRSEWYVSATKEVPGADNVRLSGTFFTKVFDGPYSAAPKWIKQTEQRLAREGKKASKFFFHYTSCPKCAKRRGHNYVVTFAQLQ